MNNKSGLVRRVGNCLLRVGKPWVVFFSLVMMAGVGLLDYYTNYDLQVSTFYLIPIAWICLGLGRRAGIWMACLSAICSLFCDIASDHVYSRPEVAYWNAVMLLGLFLAWVYSFTAFLHSYRSLVEAQNQLLDANEHLEQTVQQRTEKLKAEIAERERAEEAKWQAEQLLERKEKLAVLGTLTAGIAHEIRNPLTSLKARLYTLDKRLHDLPAAKKDTEVIGAEISRMERIVKQALSFARPSEPEMETIEARSIFTDIENLMQATLEERGIRLVIEADPKILIRGDSDHLNQVFINLVRNAADAIDRNGTIALRVRTEPATGEGPDKELAILEVSDTGKGMTADVEKRVFDPFFSTKETGTGLGLSIAARIVEKHSGRLEYRTRPGHGTTFSVTLPRVKN